MFLSNGELGEKGKIEFVKRFKTQLKENRDWEVDIVRKDAHHDEETDKIGFTVTIHARCLLTLPTEMIEAFGLEAKGIEAIECEAILNKKEREVVKKISSRA
jgi:hypothetical protein